MVKTLILKNTKSSSICLDKNLPSTRHNKLLHADKLLAALAIYR